MAKRSLLAGKRIMISASIPDELAQSFFAQSLLSELIVLCRCIFRADGNIVFGGHPSITPLIHHAAKSIGMGGEKIDLYQLRRFRGKTPVAVDDRTIFGEVRWMGSEDGSLPLEEDLAVMRDAMVQASDAAIFIGGRLKTRGIRDEYQRFARAHRQLRPAYLLGFALGETLALIEENEHNQTPEVNGLTEEKRLLLKNCQMMGIMGPLIMRDIAAFSI
ncbi:MAG: hypothetical protein QNK37_21365 [Acidobacteriota bacterium]|nr:hypothetical protein [Acidobacteriota bacterium]